MEKDPYQRRKELFVERDALIVALGGLSSYFIAVFTQELPRRWERLEGWSSTADGGNGSSPAPAGPDGAVETLRGRASEIANEMLSGPEVWGHEGSEDEIWRMRPYIPTGTGAEWTHVSYAIAAAEAMVLSRSAPLTDADPNELGDTGMGAVSPALAEILEMYSQAFRRLQKVDKAISRLNGQIATAEETTARARRWT